MRVKFLRFLLLLLPAVCLLSMAALADGNTVWQSGDGGTYATISEAIQSNPLYGTITLLKNAGGEAINVPANDRLTIDFGGYTYTVTEAQPDSPAVIVGNSSVAALKNGTLNGTGISPYLIVSYGRLTVDGMTLTAGDAEAIIYAYSGSVMIQGESCITGMCIVKSSFESEVPVPVSIQSGFFSGTVETAYRGITGGQFYNFGELPIAPGYELDENGYVVPLTSCAGHSFGAWESVDDNTHARACTQCGFTETAPHSYGAPVFDWYGDGEGGISPSCRLRCRDCGHTIHIQNVAVADFAATDSSKTYEASYPLKGGSSILTYRSYLEVANSYQVTLNGVGGSYQYGKVITLSAPDGATYYDFYEDGVLVAERATAIEVTVTRDRHFTAEPHTAQEAAPVHVSTPLKSGNKWDVTLMWAIPDGIDDSGGSEPGAEAPTLVEAGLYYLYAAEAPSAETVIQNGKQVAAPVENGEALNGSFTLTAEVSENNAKTMCALGYVIYEIGDMSYTAYADAVAVGSAADTN